MYKRQGRNRIDSASIVVSAVAAGGAHSVARATSPTQRAVDPRRVASGRGLRMPPKLPSFRQTPPGLADGLALKEMRYDQAVDSPLLPGSPYRLRAEQRRIRQVNKCGKLTLELRPRSAPLERAPGFGRK